MGVYGWDEFLSEEECPIKDISIDNVEEIPVAIFVCKYSDVEYNYDKGEGIQVVAIYEAIKKEEIVIK